MHCLNILEPDWSQFCIHFLNESSNACLDTQRMKDYLASTGSTFTQSGRKIYFHSCRPIISYPKMFVNLIEQDFLYPMLSITQ